MPSPKQTFPLLSRLYHENTKLTTARPFYITDTAERSVNGSYFDYSGRPRYRAEQRPALDAPLDRLFDARTSTSRFAGTIELDALCGALSRATRINRARVNGEILSAQRVYPSPGALYPVEIYAAALDVPGVPVSLLHWNVLEECLEELWPLGEFSMEHALPGIQPPTDQPGAVIVMTGFFPRIEWKYGERGYRFALMESAAIAHNLQLVATDMDISARWIGGYREDYWDDALRLDGDQEFSLLAFGIG
jgi:SagB-type dehydrogenase family enzyme